jgi:serine/threonine protein kinase/Flp pilus assembly protein TadD
MPNSHDYDLIDRLADEFAARYRRGERPSVQEYADRYPHLAAEIRELLPAMVEIEQVKEDLGDEAAPAPALQQLGDFHILREVGHGGMGVVYEAEQVSLGRRVALKVLSQKTLRDAKQRRRFEREARSAAKLHHTNIVPVFGVGEHDGTPYYVMQFIQGLGLDEVIEELCRMGSGGPTPAAGSSPRRSAAARQVARSLMTGAFHAGSNGPAMQPTIDGPIPSEPDALATGLRPVANASGSDNPETPVSGSGHGLHARSSDTTGLSSSVTLPGQSESGRKGHKLTYWQSVARVGVQVADALEHAHRQGVVHRDVKPSNLLLDLDGTVWVTDFGLAKADDQQNLTHTGDILGTLRYMPPEAFDGRADARGDVYALGLTLYELAALRPAFDESDRHRLIKQVTETDPSPLRAARPAVPRDLETIVHKAIDKDPAHRYQTAGELAADLQRFLDDEPIQARRLTARERAWRWCRRNPVVAGLTAAVALLLVGITVASVGAAAHFDRVAKEQVRLAAEEREAKEREAEQRQAAEAAKKLAEANFAKARAAVDDYLTKVSESQLLKVPGLQPLRAELLGSAQKFYQDFAAEHGDDPGLRADLAAALARVGDIHADMGARDPARKAYGQAVELYEAMLKPNPPNAAALKDRLAAVFQGLGDLDYNTEATRDQARQAYQRCVVLREELVQAHPENVQYQKDLARAYNGVGLTAQARNGAASFEAHRRALDIRLRLAATAAEDARLLHGLSESLHNLAVTAQQQNHIEEALAMLLRAMEYNHRAVEQAPHVVEFALDAAQTHLSAANVYTRLGRRAEAIDQYRQALDFEARYLRANPAVRDMHDRVGRTMANLVNVVPDDDQVDAVRGLFRQARDLYAGLPKQLPDDYLGWAATTGWYARSLGQWRPPQTEAEKAAQRAEYEAAVAAVRQAVAAGLTDPARLANSMFGALKDRDDFKAIVAELKAAPPRPAAAAPAPAAGGPADATTRRRQLEADRATALLTVGLLQLDFGRSAEAKQSLDQAAAAWEQLSRDEPNNVRHRLALIDQRWAVALYHGRAGRLAEGMCLYESALKDLAALAQDKPASAEVAARRVAAECALGRELADIGLFGEAAERLARALDAGPATDGPRPKTVVNMPSGDKHALDAGPATDVLDWRKLALARLIAGDQAGYRQVCARMAERFPVSTADVWTGHNLHAALTIGPGGAADPGRLVEPSQTFAEGLAQARAQQWRNQEWPQFYVGLACYRAGRFADALKWADGLWNLNLPLRALACARLGRADEARRWLTETDAASDADVRAALRDPVGVAWAATNPITENRMQFVALRREAHEVISGRPPEDPWWLLYKARLLARLERDAAAEELFARAVALRPDDPAVWLARGQVFIQLGRADRAEADFTKATDLKGTDPRPFIDAGRTFAALGDHARADRLFTRAAELTPTELNRFLEAGWWVAGPYPANFEAVCPPESSADPAKPAFAYARAATLPWQTAVPAANGQVNLRPLRTAVPAANGQVNLAPLLNTPNTSAYALAYAYSPDERTAQLLVAGGGKVRVWLNGRQVYDTTAAPTFAWGGDRVPVVLRKGRNTVLVRSAGPADGHALNVRLADGPADRGLLRSVQGLWAEAADDLTTALGRDGLRGDFFLRSRQSLMLFAAGRTAAFRAELPRMIEEFGATTSPYVANDLMRACTLAPDSGADCARLAKLVEEGWLNKGDRPTWLVRDVALGHFRAGQLDKAKRLIEEVRSKGQAPLCHPTLAMIAQRRGNPSAARALLGQAEEWYAAELARLATGPTMTVPTHDWWLVLFEAQLAEARAVVGVRPDKPPDAAALGTHHRQVLAHLDPATADFDQLLMTFSTDPRLRLARAYRLGELGRWSAAEADFAKAVEFKPKDHQVWRERGRLRAELKQWDAAAADFAQALELAPVPPLPTRAGAHDPFPWAVDRGGVDDELCRWDEAFARVAKLRPTDWGLWFRRCQHYGRLGKWPEAAAAAARTIELKPDYYMAWYLRATLLIQLGDEARYRALCRDALKQFEATADRRAVDLAAKLCLLAPGAVADYAPAVRLVDAALAGSEGSVNYNWWLLTRALADLRAGAFDRAAERLATLPPDNGFMAYDAVRAAARAVILGHSPGRSEEARRAVAEAKAILDQSCPDPARGQTFFSWWDWLHARLFVREAEALLGPAATQAATVKP